MKSLLISLMAFLCVLSVYATPSGSGTQEDPYVINDGDSYSLPKGVVVYAQFTAPSDGTLRLNQSGYGFHGFKAGDKYFQEQYTETGKYAYLSVKSGATYLIYNNGNGYADETITVVFEGVGSDALSVISCEHVQGSLLDQISWENPVVVTLSKKAKYLHYEFYGDEGILHEYYTSEAEEGEDVIMVGPKKIEKDGRVLDNTWYMYEGTTYEIVIESYKTLEGMEQGTESPEVVTLSFEGATPKTKVTTVNVLNVTPEPNLSYPTLDQCLSFKDNRKSVTVEVDQKVKVKSALIPMGMWGSKDWGTVDVEYTEEGHSIITATLSDNNMYDVMGKLTTDLTLQIALTDMDGNEIIDGGNSMYSSNFYNSGYEFNYGVNDGRFADASLMYASVTPAEDSYNTSLSKIEFKFGSYATLTSTANAALYKDDTKVADAVLTSSEDGSTVSVQLVELGTTNPIEINEFGAYVLKVDSQSIRNEFFDELTPWSDGLQGHGICNPYYYINLNVDPVILSVESIDPAPYVEGGEFSKEIPSEINIILSGEDATVNSALVTYGMNSRLPLESKVNGKVITLTIPETVLSENHIGISLSVVNANGSPVSYDGEGMITFEYQKPKNILVPTEVTPADGSTVESLSSVVLTVDANYGVGNLNTDNVITVSKDGSAAEGISASIDYAVGDDMNKVEIKLNKEVTDKGTYTLTISENTFESLDGSIYNPELTYTFIIGEGTGIDGVVAEDANAYVEVYSIDGCMVCKGKKADVVKSLKKGMYIINGQKVAIR